MFSNLCDAADVRDAALDVERSADRDRQADGVGAREVEGRLRRLAEPVEHDLGGLVGQRRQGQPDVDRVGTPVVEADRAGLDRGSTDIEHRHDLHHRAEPTRRDTRVSRRCCTRSAGRRA